MRRVWVGAAVLAAGMALADEATHRVRAARGERGPEVWVGARPQGGGVEVRSMKWASK
jgi:hypothetical protein